MSDDSSRVLDEVVAGLEEQLEEASLALQQRTEWKNARSFCDALGERRQVAEQDAEAVADLVREAEAARDLLAIAHSEGEHQAKMAEQGRTQRLAEDEALLAGLDKQCNRYRALIVAAFITPIFFITWPAIARFV